MPNLNPQKNLNSAEDKPIEYFDLIIIGANIIGAGIAREASLRGLKTVLVNMEDFASGCNANPGELVFGVERYLENTNLSLSWATAQERKILKRIAPQFAKSIPFIIPQQTNQKKSKVGRKISNAVYNFLAIMDKQEKPAQLSAKEIAQKLPGIDQKTYDQGVIFYDCNVNDHRLTLANILDASSNRARPLNYWFVDKIEDFMGKIKVYAKDLLTDNAKEFVAPVIVNTTGSYANTNLEKWGLPTYPQQQIAKSIHFFIPTLSEQYGIMIPSKDSHQVIYAVPWDKCTMVGLTDSEFVDSFECPNAGRAEIQHCLDALNQLYPDKNLTIKDVFAPTAGLKTFLPEHNSKITINKFGQGNVVTVFGGKMTLFRQISEQVVDKVVGLIKKKFASSTSSSSRLKGSQFNEVSFNSFVEHRLISHYELQKLPIDVSMTILRTYGTEVSDFSFLPFLDKPNAKDRIIPGSSNIWAQFHYSMQREFVRNPSDFAVRRSNLFLDLLKNPEHIPAYFQKAGEILKLTPQQIAEDQLHFLASFKIVG